MDQPPLDVEVAIVRAAMRLLDDDGWFEGLAPAAQRHVLRGLALVVMLSAPVGEPQ